MLSKHTPKKEEAAQATASSAATEAATKGTPPVHAQVEDTTKTKAETSVASNRERAERGDAEAQDNLGWSFYAGEGVSKDEDEAVKWFTKAAEQGNVRAQWHLGHVYRFGTGAGIKDVNEGLKWWHKAAEGGEARAQWVLGAIYSTHEKEEDAYRTGLIKDDREAVKWLRKSAEQGNANGEIYLAGMLSAARAFQRTKKKLPTGIGKQRIRISQKRNTILGCCMPKERLAGCLLKYGGKIQKPHTKLRQQRTTWRLMCG